MGPMAIASKAVKPLCLLCAAGVPIIAALHLGSHDWHLGEGHLPKMAPLLSAASLPKIAAVAPKIDFGKIAAGSFARRRVRLYNRSGSTIDIARVQSSCPCVTADLAEFRVEAHDSVSVVVSLDLLAEPEFIGGLCPTICFFDDRGCERFSGELTVEVLGVGQGGAERFSADQSSLEEPIKDVATMVSR